LNPNYKGFAAMIKKIISGGQTGADQAALDAAINYNFPYGGWIPKGRITEAGPLDRTYQLQEMPTDRYPVRTEQNVIDSDGTLILSHGKLTGGSAYTKKMAVKHKKPFLHVDLDKIMGFQAITEIHSWVIDKNIAVLNVAGPRASKDREIYNAVRFIIAGVLVLNVMNAEPGASINDYSTDELLNRLPLPPKTLDEAVETLVKGLPLKDKVAISRMDKDDLTGLYLSLGNYIRNEFKIWLGNHELLDSCRVESGQKDMTPDGASALIIEYLGKNLRQAVGLRAVK
jgi:hypothetical protein